MVSFKLVMQMMKCFPKSFITPNGQFIPCRVKGSGGYFRITDCDSDYDLKYKVIAYLSRDSYKTLLYRTKRLNDEYHEYIRCGMIKYLGVYLSQQDLDLIYTKLGNGCNKQLAYEFVWSHFDMKVLQDAE